MLAVAALAKVRDPAAARGGLRALAPARLAAWAPAPYVLAGSEAGLALGLLGPRPVALVAAVGVVVLLAVFVVALVRVARSGRAVSCGCFGAWSEEQIGRWSVARTATLLVVAVVHLGLAVAEGGVVSALGRADLEDVVTGLVLGALLVVVTALMSALGASRGAVPGAVPGTPSVQPPGAGARDRSGEPVPDVEVVMPSGEVRTLRELSNGRALVVVVASATCATCRDLLDELPAWQDDLGAGARIVVVTSSDLASMIAAHPAIEPMLTLGSGALRAVFEIPGTPAAVLLGVDGRVATRVALGADEVFGLLEGVLRRVRPSAGERAAVEVTT